MDRQIFITTIISDNGILVLNEFLAFLLYELQINDTEEEIIDAFKVSTMFCLDLK